MAVQKKISTVARRWVKTSVASLATMALVATGFVVTVAPAQAAGDVDGTVSGRVVQTFSSEGWYSLDGEAAIIAELQAQDAAIAERSGRPRGSIKEITRVKSR